MSDNPAKDGGSDKLLFGKYKTPEDAERGFRNQTMELDKWKSVATTQQEQLKVLQETLSALQKQVTTPASREEPIALANEEGQVDPRAIERLIEARQKPILDALKQVPKMMEEQIRSFLAPVQSSLRAKTEFFAREDIDAKFTDGELQKVLQRNPGINKAFEMLMSSPDTQPHAYEAVYELWRSTAGQVAKTEPPQGKRQQAKREASEPPPQAGPPLAVGGDPSVQQLGQLALQAQDLSGSDAELAFAREWIKGTDIERKIESMRPDWAPEE